MTQTPIRKHGQIRLVALTIGITIAVMVLILAGLAALGAATSSSKKVTYNDTSYAAEIVSCRVAIRDNLKDPASAQFSDEAGSSSGITGTVRAKNSFGGMTVMRFRCNLSGQVTELTKVA